MQRAALGGCPFGTATLLALLPPLTGGDGELPIGLAAVGWLKLGFVTSGTERDWETIFEIKYIFLKIIFKSVYAGPITIRQPNNPTPYGHGLSKLPASLVY